MNKKKPNIPEELLSPTDQFAEASALIGLHWWNWDNIEKNLILSPSLLKLLGYAPEDYDPSVPSIYKNIHPDDIHDNVNRMRRVISGKDEMYEIEFRIKDQEGEWKWFYNRGAAMSRDETGKGIAVGGITMDMSGQYKKLKYRADENERLYRTLFEAAEDAIGLFTVKQETVLINTAFYSMFGYDRDEFLNLGWMELIHPEDKMVLDSMGLEMLKSGVVSADFRAAHKSGSFVYVSSKSVLIPTDGSEPDMLLTILRDVTERKEAMKELEKAKEKAEESDMLKSAFLANMSHEIRTPMNSIVGFSNLLVNSGLTEAARDMYVQRIVRNSELLLNLISDIIDLAKIESNQLPLIYGRQNLSSLVGEMKQYAVDELKRLNKKDIKVHVIEVESDCEIETDVIRLSQIMKNLVNNAIKFTEKGKVQIGCKTSKSENNIILYVQDSGVGISDENFEVIFDQFRQVDGSNTRKFGGTGLGLAICKNLVEMMGGKIWVESSEEKGALFQVELPRKASLADEAAITASPDALETLEIGKPMRVMVVDDEQDSLELCYEILTRMGHEVVKASTAYEALELMHNKPLPDVVFMDDQMPVLSGTETMRIIKERYTTVKVVAQSAHALVGDRARFLQEGFDDYLPKPFSMDQLCRVLSFCQED